MSIKDNLEKAAALFGAPNEPKCVFMTKETKNKIINEAFDISEHEFVDKWVRYAKLFDDGDYLRINISNESFNTVIHNKQDAIAIAKALGVTGEDLL
ncbi:hypothetical protein BOX08_gp61 [Pseudoalteromonas phage BS5]|uniref:hypothetical protein n=1 Tax=Pseudoalteromonas phage BS5 TaxID=1874539 RepID=UPI0008199331|nr:hypothetical protein BOX08_gp61 [Pseudoalteromonas phage BS5]ANY29626.1 hypothetical protein [Pseudoalteromonas phage BS5]